MHLKNVTFHPEKYPTRDCYPFNLALFHQTQSITFNTPVTFFVGENGSGKSWMTQSHGQSLLSFFKSRYQLKGLYLRDEPETALSPAANLSYWKS